MKHIFSSRTGKDVIGLMSLFTSIFVGLSLFSYRPLDPSFNSTGTGASIQNYCGYLGSFTADILYQLIGLGAWAFAVGALYIGGRLIKRKETQYINGLFSLIIVIILSCLGSLYWPNALLFEDQIKIGGLVGTFFTGHLKAFLNPIGTSVFLWASLAITIVFLSQRPAIEIFKWPLRILSESLRAFQKYHLSLNPLRERLRSLNLKETLKNISSLFAFPEMKKSHDEDPLKNHLSLPTPPLNHPPLKASLAPPAPDVKFPLKILTKSLESGSPFFPIPYKDQSFNEEQGEPEEASYGQPFHFLTNEKGKKNGKKRSIRLKQKVKHRVDLWELPQLSLLEDPPSRRKIIDEREIQEKSHILIKKLEQFSVRGSITEICSGPAVTMFQFKPNIDVKISRITDLADDLSLALSSESVRIIAPIPGKDVVGIETSNKVRETVYLKDILANKEFWSDNIKLPMALGCQADGRSKIVDLRKIPHLLVAGSTGSGKSVFTVSMLSGLLFRHSPQTLRVILVDPKQVDLVSFNNIPHLLMPPLREVKKSVKALKWAIREMEKRYRSMSQFGARDLESFNERTKSLTDEQVAEHEKCNREYREAQKGQTYYYHPQPYIVIFIEEFGDLMAVDKNQVEKSVVRLTQMARACGIHLVLAMQSPRKDVVTGLIKTNIPGRISFKVASKMDSRIILDESGAERLLSRGDMLFSSPGLSRPLRYHGPWLSDSEILGLTNYWRHQGEPTFDEWTMNDLEGHSDDNNNELNYEGERDESDELEFDEKYDEILAQISELKEVSASLLQRKFRLGYPRAARMIELLEREGVIGPAQGSKPRQVLVHKL